MNRHNPLLDKLVMCEFCKRYIKRKRFASGRLECKVRYESRVYHTGCVKRALKVGGAAYTRRMETLGRRRARPK